MKGKLFMRCITLLVIVLCLFSKGAEANSDTNALSIPVTIKERNGVTVTDFFFRRGIAIEKGSLYSVEDVCLIEQGLPIISDAEVLQRYDDGSIHWMLISGVVQLAPDEEKTLYVTKMSSVRTDASVTKSTTGITVKGTDIGFSVGAKGVESLTFHGKEYLTNGAIRLYVTTDGKTYYMTGEEFSVVKHTDSYVKVSVSGKITDCVSGEIEITLPNNSQKLQIDHRITVTEDIELQSTGLKIGVNTASYEKGLVPKDYLDLGNIQFATFDVTRFNNKNAEINKNGFIVEDSTVTYTPVINEENFTYFDGMSRTAHLYIGFEENAELWAKTLSVVPKVTANCEQYVKAGEILTTNTGALVDAAIQTYKEEWVCGFGNFNVGAVGGYNHETLSSGGIGMSLPGEVEYNFGIAYMQTGDEELLRKMYDASELRADTMVYRGKHEECYGVMRARNWSKYGQGLPFFQSHGYYSDEGGLYMTYLLTGDEYIYESYKLCMEKTLSDMYARKALGGAYVPEYWYWGGFLTNEGDKPFKAAFYESRGMIRARTLYLAARLFEDERYKNAAYEVIKWAKNAQMESGAYNQAMYHNGNYLYQTGQSVKPVKDYVMLMGFRGISQILDWEDNQTALELTVKVADYLCSQGERFGSILMHPNSDKSVYEVNEDNTRSAPTETNIMAVDVLCTAYEKTGNDRYLTWILKFLDSYIASSVGGLGGGMKEQGYPGNRGWGSDNVRLTSLLRTSDNLNVLFREKKDVITQKGYGHLCKIFSEEALWLEDAIVKEDVPYPCAIYNTYEYGGKKIAYMFNQYVDIAKETDSWTQKLRATYNDNELWLDCTNIVNSENSVTIENLLNPRQHSVSEQIPVFVDEITGCAEITVDSFASNKAELTLKGEFQASVSFKADELPFSGEGGYAVSVFYSGGTHIVVKPGGDVYPENNIISVKVNEKGERIERIGYLYEEDFEEYGVGSSPADSFNLIRQASVEEHAGRKHLVLCDTDRKDTITSRVVRDFNGQPGERFVISLDFMIPKNGTTDAELFGVQWWSGKGWGAHLRIFGRDLYTASGATAMKPEMLMEDLEENKWYTVYAFIDCTTDTPTYRFYIGDTEGKIHSFEYTKEMAEDIIRATDHNQRVWVTRAISITERAGAPLYIDNIRLGSWQN